MTTPLAQPGAPPEAGVYTTAAARAKEANREFVAVAHDFGWLPEGPRPAILPASPMRRWARTATPRPS